MKLPHGLQAAPWRCHSNTARKKKNQRRRQSTGMELLLSKQAQEKGEKQHADMKEDVSMYRPRSRTANESKRCCDMLIC